MPLAAFQLTVTDEQGTIIPGAYVRVQREESGAPLANLFVDRDANEVMSNPAITDGQGFIRFHTAGGAFQITAFNLAGTFSRSWRYVAIGTYSEYDYGTVMAPKGAWNAATIYTTGDLVSHNYPGGGPYAFISNVDNNENHAPQFTNATTPVSDSYWTVLGMFEGVGAPGAPGAVGPAGPNLGLDYIFHAGVAPTAGMVTINTVDPTVATQIAFSGLDANITDVSGFLLARGKSTNAPKGSIMIVDTANRANWCSYNLTTPLTLTSGYYLGSVVATGAAGILEGARVGVLFSDAGDKGINGTNGVDGAPGAPGAPGPGGDVVGPSSVLVNQFALYANATGKLIKADTNSELVNGQPHFMKTTAETPGGSASMGIKLGAVVQGIYGGGGPPTLTGATAGGLYMQNSAGAGAAWVAQDAANWLRLLTAGITDLQIFTAVATVFATQRPSLPEELDDPEFLDLSDLDIALLSALTGNIIVGPTTRKLLLLGQAAGGAGGGCTAAASTAGGGGGPGETRAAIVTVTPGQSIPFSIGAEGLPGAAGASTGGTGADLTIGASGAIMVCKGGAGGSGAGGGGIGASGGTPTGSGGIRIPPTAFATSFGTSTLISQGGSCWFGEGGLGVVGASWPGSAARGPGGGGSGGLNGSGSTARAGGQGGVGQILVVGFGG